MALSATSARSASSGGSLQGTKRRFLPNLQSKRFWVEGENRWVRLRVSHAGLRTIDKKGIDVVLAELRAAGVKV